MAHVAKFGKAGYEAIIRHCERSLEATRERANIDEKRTKYNYQIGDGDVRERVRECMEMHNDAGRALRDDAVLMADWIVTQPRDLPDDRTQEFFHETYEFIKERYGADNVPRAYVHMDETTPHMHCPVVPFDEQAHRLRASSIITRADLRSFHGELADHIERTMGRRYAVELTEEQRQERAVGYRPMREFQDAQDRLEGVRRAADEAERGLERMEQRRPGIRVGERERAARERFRGLRERFAEGVRKLSARIREMQESLRTIKTATREVREETRQLDQETRKVQDETRELDARNQELKARLRDYHERMGHNEPAHDREPDRVPARAIEHEWEPGRPIGYPEVPDQEQLEELEPDRENVIDFPEFDYEQEIDLFIER